MLPQDIAKWTVRNGKGEMVPFSAFSSSYWAYGSPQLMRYNGNPAYEMEGRAARASARARPCRSSRTSCARCRPA